MISVMLEQVHRYIEDYHAFEISDSCYIVCHKGQYKKGFVQTKENQIISYFE